MMTLNIKSTRFTLTVVLLLCALMAKADEWQEASQVVGKSTQAMLSLLEQGRLDALRDSETAGETVPLDVPKMLLGMEVIMDTVIDFESLAKGVMAKFYRRASPLQIDEFQAVFKRSLLNTYSGAVMSLEIDNFEIQPNPTLIKKPGRQKVWVKVLANGAAYDINYAMKKRQQGWRVTNVTIDGINLGLAFRKQFSSAMAQRKGNMDDVIAFWNDPS
ncbi:MAG: ABC transporter substrate-binding protein [Oceanospirillaceae bacterium]|nr:ABC transporter substrate-binding protein [Oceanospirillaceae bacterium]